MLAAHPEALDTPDEDHEAVAREFLMAGFAVRLHLTQDALQHPSESVITETVEWLRDGSCRKTDTFDSEEERCGCLRGVEKACLFLGSDGAPSGAIEEGVMRGEITRQSLPSERFARLREEGAEAQRMWEREVKGQREDGAERAAREYNQQSDRELQELDAEEWEPDVVYKLVDDVHFWRRAYAATLDPQRVQAIWTYVQTVYPYGDVPVLGRGGPEAPRALGHCSGLSRD